MCVATGLTLPGVQLTSGVLALRPEARIGSTIGGLADAREWRKWGESLAGYHVLQHTMHNIYRKIVTESVEPDERRALSAATLSSELPT